MASETEARFGGAPSLRLVLKGGPRLADAVLSTAEGGGKLDVGLRDRVAEQSSGRVTLQVETELTGTHLEFAGEVANGSSGLVTAPPDLVVISVEADALDPDLAPTGDYFESMRELVGRLKALGVYVFMLNASTVDPTSLVSVYSGSAEPFTRRAQRLDLALLRLSIDQGISIIDADRILAEAGAAQHVVAPLDYSPHGCALVRDEILRVMVDCGFFETRPLMPQMGRAS